MAKDIKYVSTAKYLSSRMGFAALALIESEHDLYKNGNRENIAFVRPVNMNRDGSAIDGTTFEIQIFTTKPYEFDGFEVI